MSCRCACCHKVKEARKLIPPIVNTVTPEIIKEEEIVEQIDSPINLDQATSVVKRGRLIFKGLSKLPELIRMENTGDMLLLNFKWPENDPEPPTVTKGVLKDDVFTLHQIYFHWGSTDTVGSDHRINNEQYPGEVHLVYYNSKFLNFGDALQFNDSSKNRVKSILIVAILYKTDHDAPCRKFTSFINELVEPRQFITITDENRFNIKDIIEVGVWSYFQYNSRILKPFYHENITFIVANFFATIKRAELANFRNLLNNEYEPIVDNFVGLNEVGTRKVFFYP